MNSPGPTLAFAESPVQLLNILEWAHLDGTALTSGTPGGEGGLTVVILPPREPVTRGQLRRMAELAGDAGFRVRWQEARGGAAPSRALAALAGPLRRARRLVVGDPFSRYLQLLLSLTGRCEVVVVDDGTATMEFTAQVARGEPLVRWHRAVPRGPRAALFAPLARRALRQLTPAGGRAVEMFTAMPVEAPPGFEVSVNAFAWTRARFGPPELTGGADMVGTSLVETGVVDPERYLAAVTGLVRRHGVTRYLAHRKESEDKLARIAGAADVEIVRPDLPLELVARRGPIGSAILSFPSTVVHTLPLVLKDTRVDVAVCDVSADWLTDRASDRAGGFLSSVTSSARDAHGLSSL